MTISRNIVLGERTFAVPVLPLRHNRVIYPLCRDLSALEGEDTFFARLEAKQGTPDAVRDDEWDKLIEIAFHAACAADQTLTREAFDEMSITPPQFIDAFFIVRLQTGAWLYTNPGTTTSDTRSSDAKDEGDKEPGEETGA